MEVIEGLLSVPACDTKTATANEGVFKVNASRVRSRDVANGATPQMHKQTGWHSVPPNT